LNHVLNLACTVADSGALGAILWTFELREVLTELAENETGARLHVNLAFSAFCSNVNETTLFGNLAIIEILMLSVIAARVSKSRLLGNFIVSVNSAIDSAVTGWLLWSSGISATETKINKNQTVGGYLSDSMVRHVGRLLQANEWLSKLSA